jgi:predicted transcriptional regulator
VAKTKKENKKAKSLSLSPSLVERLKRAAKEQERSTSYLAERAIREFLERRSA